ncbi:MAG: glycerophosphodiester phosphodiesterase [Elusimicrobiota bacterium]|jgi:glycerophosphoryl diester phosphodiesterase|nr:glycerophosphodiester phosphodiesterase [Elusimicrobiota bacterium]
MIIIAHRGASGYKQENTLAAFEEAARLGANYFETDVQQSKDGKLIVYHDYALKNGRAIKDSTFAELAAQNIPTLLQVLQTLGPKNHLNIEIKNDANLYPNIEEEIAALLNTLPAKQKEKILISSFDLPTLQRYRNIDKKIKIGVLTRNFNLREALDLGAFSVNLSVKIISPQIVEICHKNNLKVFVYTVNDKEKALALKNMGVDGIFSDYPDILK